MSNAIRAYEGTYHDEQAIWLQAGPYEAAVLPRIGANLIAFRDTDRGYSFLREPGEAEMDAFRGNPGVHGIPVLFPPNRYDAGKFPWEGTTYQLPVNETARGNHLHGFAHTTPWKVERFGADEAASRVALTLSVSEGHEVYAHYPFDFTLTLEYTLSEEGLLQRVSVRNDGPKRLPCLLAFHTAINAPFARGSETADVAFKLTIGDRWEMGPDDRMLPTGRFQPLSDGEVKMREGGQSPFFESMDNHYTAKTQNGRNYMELTDSRAGAKLVYDVGTAYRMWMIWNNGARGGFFCPEPQINLVNAPNVDLPAEDIGLIGLEQGELWEETSRLYVIRQA
ncbi:aldose 1-epimerase [Cohnella fermenti]|uniref:Aldose 1-epimerase n=1 Tax=Cohnella fermenti TaxID=2565925 RepID=A0A4S4C8Y2_9BACL|nr:aldose 1-epimerase [Cohnella fermenti]THF84140.1 aldose 1-epimerase [Cohnella fermenti]